MRVHQLACVFDAGVFSNGNQAFARGHDAGNRRIQAFFKTQVAIGYQTHHFAVFHHRQAGHLVFALGVD